MNMDMDMDMDMEQCCITICRRLCQVYQQLTHKHETVKCSFHMTESDDDDDGDMVMGKCLLLLKLNKEQNRNEYRVKQQQQKIIRYHRSYMPLTVSCSHSPNRTKTFA